MNGEWWLWEVKTYGNMNLFSEFLKSWNKDEGVDLFGIYRSMCKTKLCTDTAEKQVFDSVEDQLEFCYPWKDVS